jgi:hypothetical protein
MLLSLRPAHFLKISGKGPEAQGQDWGKRVVGRTPQAIGAWTKLKWTSKGSPGPQLIQLADDGSVLGALLAPAVVEGQKKGLVSVHGEAIARPKELVSAQVRVEK